MDVLCLMHEGDPYGYLTIDKEPVSIEDIASLAGIDVPTTKSLMDELERRGVFSRDRHGVIFSRRMVRDEKRKKDGEKAQKKRKNYNNSHDSQQIEKPIEITEPNGLANGLPYMATHNSEAISHKPDSKKRKRKEYIVHPKFDELWNSKPGRLGGNSREKAAEIFSRIVESGVDPERIVAGAKAWTKTHERIGNLGTQFVPMVTSWLNARGWEDDLFVPEKKGGYHPWNR